MGCLLLFGWTLWTRLLAGETAASVVKVIRNARNIYTGMLLILRAAIPTGFDRSISLAQSRIGQTMTEAF